MSHLQPPHALSSSTPSSKSAQPDIIDWGKVNQGFSEDLRKTNPEQSQRLAAHAYHWHAVCAKERERNLQYLLEETQNEEEEDEEIVEETIVQGQFGKTAVPVNESPVKVSTSQPLPPTGAFPTANVIPGPVDRVALAQSSSIAASSSPFLPILTHMQQPSWGFVAESGPIQTTGYQAREREREVVAERMSDMPWGQNNFAQYKLRELELQFEDKKDQRRFEERKRDKDREDRREKREARYRERASREKKSPSAAREGKGRQALEMEEKERDEWARRERARLREEIRAEMELERSGGRVDEMKKGGRRRRKTNVSQGSESWGAQEFEPLTNDVSGEDHFGEFSGGYDGE